MQILNTVINGVICVPNLDVLPIAIPRLVGTGPVKEAGILNLLIGCLLNLDIPTGREVLKVLLERQCQWRLRPVPVYNLLPILLGELSSLPRLASDDATF